MLHISHTSPYALNRNYLIIAFSSIMQTLGHFSLPHVSLVQRGHLFGRANNHAVEASLVLAVHSADQAERDRYLKRDG